MIYKKSPSAENTRQKGNESIQLTGQYRKSYTADRGKQLLFYAFRKEGTALPETLTVNSAGTAGYILTAYSMEKIRNAGFSRVPVYIPYMHIYSISAYAE